MVVYRHMAMYGSLCLHHLTVCVYIYIYIRPNMTISGYMYVHRWPNMTMYWTHMDIPAMPSYAWKKHWKNEAWPCAFPILYDIDLARLVHSSFQMWSPFYESLSAKNLCAAMRGPFHLYGHIWPCMFVVMYGPDRWHGPRIAAHRFFAGKLS